jgi:hypothetical protein
MLVRPGVEQTASAYRQSVTRSLRFDEFFWKAKMAGQWDGDLQMQSAPVLGPKSTAEPQSLQRAPRKDKSSSKE